MDNEHNKLKVIDRDMIKYIVVFFMGVGHFVGYYFAANTDPASAFDLPFPLWLSIEMSLIAPPTLFFFITEGYRYTRSRKKYALRLLIFASITQIPFRMLFLKEPYNILDVLYFNVIFTLLLGLLAISVYESDMQKPLKIFLTILIYIVSVFTEWNPFGIAYIMIWHVYRDDRKKLFITYTLLTLVMKILQFATNLNVLTVGQSFAEAFAMFIAQMLPLFIITYFYNGKKGKHPVFAKWFFYIFYPAHLLFTWVMIQLK